MINLKGKDSVADAVQSVLNQEATDVDARTKDDIGGRKKTTQKDDVGPSADGKSTKVKLQGESTEKTLADTKPATIVKTEDPEPREKVDIQAKKANKSLRGFKEKFEQHSIFDQMIAEVLSKDASAGEWIHDFVHSDNPKFAGKSKAERKKQALAAYYAKQKNEEVVDEGVVDTVKKVAKKVGEVLGGPDDEGHKKDLQRKMGIPQTGKPSMAKQNEEVEVLDEGKMDKMSLSQLWHKHAQHTYGADQGWGGGQGGHHSHHAATAIENHVRKHHGNKVADDMLDHSDLHVAHAEYVGGSDAKQVVHDAEKLRKKHGIKGDLYGMHNESVNEGWDDMLKDVKSKKGPQPNGGSGKKQGTAYGGSKQKDKPEQDEDKKVNEGKEEDVPFDPPFSKKPSEATDKSGAKHTPMSRAHHLARSAMSRIKKDLDQKKGK